MKAAAALLVLLAVMAPAASAQPHCEQCAPLEAWMTFLTWAGEFGRCTPAMMQCGSNEAVTFSVGTVNGSCLYYERAWNFGDGTTSTEQMPTHVFGAPGTYNVSVTLTTWGGCNPPQSFGLSAAITVSPTVWCDECPPVTPATSYIAWSDPSRRPIAFTVGTWGANFSCRAYTFQWDFGDGTTSNQFTPTHTYGAVGIYAVSVTVSSVDSCTLQPESFTLKQTVTVTQADRPQRRRSCCGH